MGRQLSRVSHRRRKRAWMHIECNVPSPWFKWIGNDSLDSEWARIVPFDLAERWNSGRHWINPFILSCFRLQFEHKKNLRFLPFQCVARIELTLHCRRHHMRIQFGFVSFYRGLVRSRRRRNDLLCDKMFSCVSPYLFLLRSFTVNFVSCLSSFSFSHFNL